MTTPLEQEVNRLKEQLIEWRRDFHRHPEIAYQEQRTSSVLRRFLENLGLPVRNLAKTGLRAELKGGRPGKTVALRADMDALPVQEESGKEYASENPGAMHACGHDGHMAILMGVAKLLSGRREELKGSVVFLFQPSEERHPGGAKPMIEEGALDGVDAVFGLHLWQSFPTGKVGILPGPMMAQSDEFAITVQGKGGHGSMPHQTVDPILVASQIVVNMQSIVSRNVDPLKSAVVSFGEVAGGSAHNIIPEKVMLTGTV
ncbi:MAG TPA: amidohydrolase, partial [Bacteroidetes bacterium]|nr:amidohydrolase [Bacteroidota bacterium]